MPQPLPPAAPPPRPPGALRGLSHADAAELETVFDVLTGESCEDAA